MPDTTELQIINSSYADFLVKRLPKIGVPYYRGKPDQHRDALKRGYYNGSAFQVSGKHIFIAWEPRLRKAPRPLLAPMIVNFHLSQFDDVYKFLKWGGFTFSKKGLPLVLKGDLTRFDLAIDTEVSIDRAEQEVVQPRARSERKIESKTGKTLYWGKRPRRTRAYEREVPRMLLDHQVGTDNDPGEIIKATRFEVEHCGRRKVPIKCLMELDKLRNLNPFSHLKFLNQESLHVSADTPPKIRHKLMAFQLRCHQIGAQAARKEFNKDRNFKRTVEKYLVPNTAFDFSSAWENRIERFLGPRPVKFPMQKKGGKCD